MFIRVPGADIKEKFLNLLAGKASACIHFKWEDNKLKLQALGLVNSEVVINVTECDGISPTEFSVGFDKAVALISEEEELFIDASENSFEIKQESFHLVKKYEFQERINYTRDPGMKKFKYSQFCKFVKNSKAMDGLSKELFVPLAEIEIMNNFGVIQYSNCIYIDKIEMDNCCITSEASRQLDAALSRSNNPTYTISDNKTMLYVDISGEELSFLPISRPDPMKRNALKTVISSLKFVTTVSIAKYLSQLQIICREYKKLKIELNVFESSLGVDLTISGGTSFKLGPKERPKFSIRISVEQLSVITKLFADSTTINIERGERILCLKSPNSEKRLLISGMIY